MKTITRKVFAALISLNIVLSSFYPLFFAKAVYAVEAGYCQDGWTFNGGDAGDDSNWEYTGCGASQNDEEQRRQEEEQRQREEEERRQEEEAERERQRQEEQRGINEQRQSEEQEREAERERERERQEAEQREAEPRDEEAENVQPAETQTSYIVPEPDPQNYYTAPPQYDTSFTAPADLDLDTKEALINPDSRPKNVTTEVMAGGVIKTTIDVSNVDINKLCSQSYGLYNPAFLPNCSPEAVQINKERAAVQILSIAQQKYDQLEQSKTEAVEVIKRDQKRYSNETAKTQYDAMLISYEHYKQQMDDNSLSPEQRSVISAVVVYQESQLESLRQAADKEAKQSAAEAAAKEKERRKQLVQQEIQYAADYINSRPSYLTEAQSKKTYLDDRIRVYTERLENATSEREKTDYNIKLNTLQDHLKGTEQAYNQEQAANKDKESADLQQAKDRQAQQMKDYLDTYAAGDSDAAKDKRKAFANHFLNEYKKALADSSVSERNKEIDQAIINYLEEELKRLGPQTAMEVIKQRKQAELAGKPNLQDKAIKNAKQAAKAGAARNQGNAAAARQAGSGNGGLVQTVAALPNQTADVVENAIENAIDLVQDLLGGSDDTKQSFNLIPEVLAQTAASPAADMKVATGSAQSASKEIQLVPGWNLITIPAIPTKPLTASVLLQDIALQGGYATTVSRLQNGQWNSFVIRGDAVFGGDDFAIEPGKSYFVKALLSSTYIMVDSLDFVAPVKLNVGRGWNAVGFPFMASDMNASLLIDKINEHEVEADSLARWESGLWDTFIKQQQEEYGENFAIESNRGYLLKVKKQGTISP